MARINWLCHKTHGYGPGHTPTPMLNKYPWKQAGLVAAALAGFVTPAFASESDIKIPDLSTVQFFNGALTGHAILMIGLVVCALGVVYGWM